MGREIPDRWESEKHFVLQRDLAPMFWSAMMTQDALALGGKAALLWVRMLATAGPDGVCRVPVEALAGYTHGGRFRPLSEEDLDASLAVLTSGEAGFCTVSEVEGGYKIMPRTFRIMVDTCYKREVARRQKERRERKREQPSAQ